MHRFHPRTPSGRSGGWVLTVNLDHLHLFGRAPWYAALCAQASLVVTGGMPLIWISRLQGTPLPERIAGSNLISSLSAAAAREGRSIFLLGGNPGTAVAAATRLQQRYPTLRVAGTLCPSMGFENDPQQLTMITSVIRTAAPDIVYIGLGKPKQELLIERLRQQRPQAWYVGVGISFSFLSGQIPRAPVWMQRAGLEWVHRLLHEPRRLTPRYLMHGFPLAVTLFSCVAIDRWCRSHRDFRR